MKKKMVKPEEHREAGISRESTPAYRMQVAKTRGKQLLTKDFLYSDFRKIADKAPFTIGEWALMLHISERTLHRYAKENAAFNGLQVERILHLEKLINLGNTLFGKEGFKHWLHFKPFSLESKKPEEMLSTYEGIQEVIDILGRMQHGIPA